MTIPLVTQIPTPVPSTQDPADFDNRGDATLGGMPVSIDTWNQSIAAINTLAPQIDAAAVSADASAAAASAAASAAINAAGYVATSASSLSLTAGSKTVQLDQTDTLFDEGDKIVAIRRANSDQKFYGEITDWDGIKVAQVAVTSNDIVGAGGPFTDWIIILEAFAQSGAVAADVRKGTSTNAAVTPASLTDAAAFITLIYASTVTWNTEDGFNAALTLVGNPLIAAPSNLKDGAVVTLALKQDGTGSRAPSWDAKWDWGEAGAPTLQTGANKEDYVFAIYRATSDKLIANFRKGA